MHDGVRRRSFLAGAFGALSAAREFPAIAQEAPIEWRCASSQPTVHPATIRAAQLWSAVAQDSGGRLQVKFFPNSQLGGDAAMLTQLRVGATQMMLIAPANFASVVPAADIANLGFAYKDAEEALAVMQGAVGDYVRAQSLSKGIYLMRPIMDGGMYQIGSIVRPVRTPADLKGFKIRVAGGRIMSDLFKDLGASPVPISANEMYTAQQTRIIDGVTLPLISYASYRMYEVNRFVSITNHSWSGIMFAANGDAWRRLPGELQAIVERNVARYAALEDADARQMESRLSGRLPGQGIAVNSADQAPFRALLGSYYEFWANEFGHAAWALLETALRRRVA